MRFDVDRIAKQVANRIAGKIDCDLNYMDFKEQAEAVNNELEWLLDRGIPSYIYKDLLNLVTDHPEVQFVFEVAEQQRAYIIASGEQNEYYVNQQYMRDAL